MKISTLFTSLCLIITLLAAATVSNPGVVFAQLPGVLDDTTEEGPTTEEETTTEEEETTETTTEEETPESPIGPPLPPTGPTFPPTRPPELSSQIANQTGGNQTEVPTGPTNGGPGPTFPEPTEEPTLLGLQNTPENRQFAATAGDLHNQGLAEREEIFDEAQGNPVRMAELIVQNLTEENLVTPDESQDLMMIIQVLNNNQTNPSDLINRLSSINNQLIEENASPVAIAVSDVALSSTQYWLEKFVGPDGDLDSPPASIPRWVGWLIVIVVSDVAGCLWGLWKDTGCVDTAVDFSFAIAPTVSGPLNEALMSESPADGDGTTPRGGGTNVTNTTTTNATNATTTTPTTEINDTSTTTTTTPTTDEEDDTDTTEDTETTTTTTPTTDEEDDTDTTEDTETPTAPPPQSLTGPQETTVPESGPAG